MRRRPRSLPGIESEPGAERDPESPQEVDRGEHITRSAVEVSLAEQALDGDGEESEERDHHHGVRLVVADVLDAVTVLGFVEALVLDLPATLREGVDGSPGELAGGHVREPVGLDGDPIPSALAVADHPNG